MDERPCGISNPENQSMGYARAKAIEPAGEFLLKELRRVGSLKFSDIIDNRVKGIGQHFEVAVGDSFFMLDLAAQQLYEQGIIELECLDSQTSDGMPDYSITLTNAGRVKLERGFVPTYHGLDL
jgi:hypothetical protein